MGIGVNIHWKWYQPLRNRYGFVMFLGHGALLRRSCWEEVGGFPEIVSEDLAYAIALRELGYHGFFAEDVICEEEFPDTVRAFRVRHVKWTRGTCEFLMNWMGRLLRARRITTAEKLDVLFPTLNLPMTFFFFLFMVNSQFVFPFVLGEFRILTFELGGTQLHLQVLSMKDEMNAIFGADFYAITILTVLAPVLCFMLELWRQPLKLFRFLTHSAALYAALSPLTFISVTGFALTRKAKFLVTGDTSNNGVSDQSRFWSETHPDSLGVRGFEWLAAALFATAAVIGFQVSFIGLAIGFALLPLMHSLGWSNRFVRVLVWIPFSLVVAGMGVGALGMAGLAPVFFGFGFHF
jgi:cellulose synthase/poly-beta-1,6-N-acetylglucosamine synthase-like glycosyltransferase